MLSILKLPDILANGGTTNTCMTLHIHVVPQSKYNGLNLCREFASWRQHERLSFTDGDIDRLEDRDRKGGGFTGTGLRLRNDIATLCDRQNSSLLNSRWFFKVCGDFFSK